MMNADQEICVICKKETVENDEVVKIRKKGADGFNSASDQRGDNIVVAAGDTVHKTCRWDFINKKDNEIDNKAKLDSALAVKRSAHVSNSPYDSKQELGYRKQIARQLRTQFVVGISVTLQSTLRVTQGHWKRNHWTDHTRLTIRRVIGR